jgi:hypothetical protein
MRGRRKKKTVPITHWCMCNLCDPLDEATVQCGTVSLLLTRENSWLLRFVRRAVMSVDVWNKTQRKRVAFLL